MIAAGAGSMECPDCDGSGNINITDGGADWDRCPRCQGAGWFKREICSVCQGPMDLSPEDETWYCFGLCMSNNTFLTGTEEERTLIITLCPHHANMGVFTVTLGAMFRCELCKVDGKVDGL